MIIDSLLIITLLLLFGLPILIGYRVRYEGGLGIFLAWLISQLLMFRVTCILVCFIQFINPTPQGLYTDGEQVGIIYNQSYKGLHYKTHEAIMNCGGTTSGDNGLVLNTFEFSVNDSNVLNQVIDAVINQKLVKVHYKEYNIKSYRNGETEYYVDKVTTVP